MAKQTPTYANRAANVDGDSPATRAKKREKCESSMNPSDSATLRTDESPMLSLRWASSATAWSSKAFGDAAADS